MPPRKHVHKLEYLVHISFFSCRWISCKEIDPLSIERMRILAIEFVCMIEKTFPTSILSTQIHIVVHVVDEMAIAGIVHTQWMFYLEQFIKTLKAFV